MSFIDNYLKKHNRRLTKRGRRVETVILVLLALLLMIAFGHFTKDICYVGESGNLLGYGSCEAMIDEVIGENK